LRQKFLFMLICVLVGANLVACGGKSGSSKAANDSVIEVVRQPLQSAASEKAPGQIVGLSRVIIPAGQGIAAHTHPGPQLAVIVEGTLTYTVIQGQVQATHGSGPDARNETIKPGQTVELNPGDSLLETPGMVHTAKNAGKTPVVIYVSSLFPDGAPASSPAQ
jgi:quercetin dioxygenase-like cupin family protein